MVGGGPIADAGGVPSGYGQYCPIALATELLGERWTILVVLAVMDGATRFSEMQRAMPRISPSVLSQRLRTLEEAGVLRKRRRGASDGAEYALTDAGEDLAPIILDLGEWGQRWARDLVTDDLDPHFLAWSMHLRMNTAAMPAGRTVIEFEFSGAPRGIPRFWIVSNDGVVDLCIKHPGHEVDLRVYADLRRFVEAWRGFRSLRGELRAGRIRLEGPAALRRAFPSWLLLSSLAGTTRRRAGRERRLSHRTRSSAGATR